MADLFGFNEKLNEYVEKIWKENEKQFDEIVIPMIKRDRASAPKFIENFIQNIKLMNGLDDFFKNFIFNKLKQICTNKYKECKSKAILDELDEISKLKSIDVYDDTFYWGDFVTRWNGVFIDDYELFEVLGDLRRVYAYINTGKGKSIQKVSEQEPMKIFGKVPSDSFYIIMESGTEEKPKHERITIDKFVKIADRALYFTYGSIVNIPYPPGSKNPAKPNQFNIFCGFKAKLVNQVNMELIEPILHHLKYVWSGGNDEWFHWILSWLSWIIKTPYQKTLIALVLISKQGSGKDILRVFIEENIIGIQHAIMVCGLDKITQRFNSITIGKLLVTINELGCCDTKSAAFTRLKSIITEQRQCIEPKGVDSEIVVDYANYLMESNDYTAIHLDDEDRRYACPDVSCVYRGDFVYFNKLKASLNQEAGDHFMTFLFNYNGLDIKNFNLIPKSTTKTEMVEYSLPAPNSFINGMIDKQIDLIHLINLLNRSDPNDPVEIFQKKKSVYINRTHLYRVFSYWAGKNNYMKCKPGKFNIVAKCFYSKKPEINGSRVNMLDISQYITNEQMEKYNRVLESKDEILTM